MQTRSKNKYKKKVFCIRVEMLKKEENFSSGEREQCLCCVCVCCLYHTFVATLNDGNTKQTQRERRIYSKLKLKMESFMCIRFNLCVCGTVREVLAMYDFGGASSCCFFVQGAIDDIRHIYSKSRRKYRQSMILQRNGNLNFY